MFSPGRDPSKLGHRIAMGFEIQQFHGVFSHTFKYDLDFTFDRHKLYSHFFHVNHKKISNRKNNNFKRS